MTDSTIHDLEAAALEAITDAGAPRFLTSFDQETWQACLAVFEAWGIDESRPHAGVPCQFDLSTLVADLRRRSPGLPLKIAQKRVSDGLRSLLFNPDARLAVVTLHAGTPTVAGDDGGEACPVTYYEPSLHGTKGTGGSLANAPVLYFVACLPGTEAYARGERYWAVMVQPQSWSAWTPAGAADPVPRTDLRTAHIAGIARVYTDEDEADEQAAELAQAFRDWARLEALAVGPDIEAEPDRPARGRAAPFM